MITLRYSAKRDVNVNRGLARNWQKAFTRDDIRVPESWEHAIEVGGAMVTFAFAYVANAKIPAGEYIVVQWKGTRQELQPREPGNRFPDDPDEQCPSFANPMIYICPVMAILRPCPQEIGGIDTCDREGYCQPMYFLKKVAVAHFSDFQKREWVAAKKMSVC